MNRNRTSSNRRDSLVSCRSRGSIQASRYRKLRGVPDAPSAGAGEHLCIPRVLSVACEGATSKTRSVISENDQGARLAKNRGFALQSFATTTDMDREHTLSVRLDWFADCGYWSSLLSILHQGSRPFSMHDDVTDPIAGRSPGNSAAPVTRSLRQERHAAVRWC